MKSFRLTAKLLSPLMVQKKRQSFASPTVAFLPGSTLRGALAARCLRAGGGADNPAFQSLFIDQPVAFPNLIPAPDADVRMIPLPLSAVSCKRHPGFPPEGHGVKDTLAEVAAVRLGHRDTDRAPWKCAVCGQDLKPVSGFRGDGPNGPRRFEPTLISQRHTGIDRATGTVAMGAFFMTQGIADHYKDPDPDTDVYRPQYLTGELFMAPEKAELLNSLLDETVFVGAERTRGMGEIELRLQEVDRPAFDLNGWSNAFRSRLEAQMGADKVPAGTFFSITLRSNAVLVDRFLRPCSEIDPLDGDQGDVEPVAKMTVSETVRGWQAAWGLPKPDDVAVGMGSVLLYRYTGGQPDTLEKNLRALEESGIGLRREEGFGQIAVCEPLHLEEENG